MTNQLGAHMQVATSIVKRIMLDEFGLQYICATADRFFQAAMALATMVNALAEQPSARLLKHVVRCYLRLTDNPRYALSSACQELVSSMYRSISSRSNDDVLLDRHLTAAGPVPRCRSAFLSL
jgi:hypothetical protein